MRHRFYMKECLSSLAEKASQYVDDYRNGRRHEEEFQ